MPEISREEIDHLAKLARLTLSSEEKEKFAKQLPGILHFVDQLQSVAQDAQPAQAETTPLAKLRTDQESGDRLTIEDLEKLAPAWRDNQIEVPAVFGETPDA